MEVPKETEVGSELGRLASEVRQGVAGAENSLARLLFKPLQAMCRMRRLPPEDADDLIQETLLTVIRHLRSDAPITFDAIGAFTRSTAIFILTGQRRRDARRNELMNQAADDLMPLPSRSPDQELGQSQIADAVSDAVAGLGQVRDRALIRSHYLLQRDKQSLCAEFELSGGQFDRVIHNARQRLLHALRQRGWGKSDGH